MEFLCITSTLKLIRTTPGIQYKPTYTYNHCPPDLDIVVIGGLFLDHRLPPAERFIKEVWTKMRVWITTCIGSLWLAASSVLDGYKCMTNRLFMATAKNLAPRVEWID